MKFLKNLLLYFVVPVALIYVTSKISRSNSAYVDYSFKQVDSVGGNGGEIPAISKLNELVEENFLDRDYYEAFSVEENTWHECCANYNKKHQALFIGGSDGWSYYFYATPAELKMITDRKIPAHKLHQFLKPFPQEYLIEIPTRSRDFFSVF